ncbi:MAG: tetratricopeptide repeat protein [Nitratireductor sp.]
MSALQLDIQQQSSAFQAAIMRSDWGLALSLARSLEEAMPRNAAIAYNKGLVLRRLGREDEAALALRHAIDLEPRHANAQFELAACLMETGNLDDAAKGFRDYVHIMPDDADAHLNLGNVLVRLGRAQEALEYLNRAHRRLDNMESATALAIALRETGDLDGCAAALTNIASGPDGLALQMKILTQGAKGRFGLKPGQVFPAR